MSHITKVKGEQEAGIYIALQLYEISELVGGTHNEYRDEKDAGRAKRPWNHCGQPRDQRRYDTHTVQEFATLQGVRFPGEALETGTGKH